ncbi:hypothetical protein [Streptomyces sp. CB01881]|uniref:hypothetical protein n=1 Tax=Streptomyces sp. CB01881 TaxID=2078691 RepID=UPI000CDC8475|nr:hypothetical protein [Streptomyces sp. CB01881]AUY49889.1 hypothetical protein C2142_14250 [Streptomyces sp. CB01881]TYC73284.1 hypothetical protein EH183_14235 [Streptomyces sp. CB01881]
MPKLQQRVVDGPFGPMQISHDRRPSVVARVQGAGMPTVTVVPDRDHGAMNINGHNIPTSRTRNRTRTAVVGDRSYELRPLSLRRAELRRNGTLIAHARGSFRSYAPGSTIPGLDAGITWSQGIDPTDVAIGQAMILGFGAGAPGVILRTVFFWVDNLT